MAHSESETVQSPCQSSSGSGWSDIRADGSFVFSDNCCGGRVQSDGIPIVGKSSSANMCRIGIIRHVDIYVSDVAVRIDGHGDGVKDIVELPVHDEFFSAIACGRQLHSLDATSTCSEPSVQD